MRWLVIHPGPNFSVADVHNGWCRALRDLGEQVLEYQLDVGLQFFDTALLPEPGAQPDAEGRQAAKKAFTSEQAVSLAADGIFGAAYRWWPHYILCVSAFFTPPAVLEIMRTRKHKIIMLFTEQPYQQAQQLHMAEYADITLLNDPTGIDAYREVCPVAEYTPHSYDPKIHYPAAAGTRPEFDLAFVGTGFKSRIEFFEAMRLDGLRVALGGLWPGLPEDSPLRGHMPGGNPDGCIDNTDTAALYRRAATGINFYRREAEDGWDQRAWAMGPREVEMAACGLWFPRDPRGESDEMLGMLPSFSGPEEAGDLIRWAIANPDKRRAAARKARQAVQDRTFSSAAKRLLQLLQR